MSLVLLTENVRGAAWISKKRNTWVSISKYFTTLPYLISMLVINKQFTKVTMFCFILKIKVTMWSSAICESHFLWLFKGRPWHLLKPDIIFKKKTPTDKKWLKLCLRSLNCSVVLLATKTICLVFYTCIIICISPLLDSLRCWLHNIDVFSLSVREPTCFNWYSLPSDIPQNSLLLYCPE